MKKSIGKLKSFYILPAGLMLKRILEIQRKAERKGEDVAQAVYRWAMSAATELAAQSNRSSDSFVSQILELTESRISRNGGAPLGNKNAAKKSEKEEKKSENEEKKAKKEKKKSEGFDENRISDSQKMKKSEVCEPAIFAQNRTKSPNSRASGHAQNNRVVFSEQSGCFGLKGIRKEKNRREKKNTPPPTSSPSSDLTIEEATAKLAEQGYTKEEVRRSWGYYARLGWCNTKGAPIPPRLRLNRLALWIDDARRRPSREEEEVRSAPGKSAPPPANRDERKGWIIGRRGA